MVVHYSFDGVSFRQLNLPIRGSGYGALLDCDTGEIHVYDPASISYYIEGLDASGQAICSNGQKEQPFDVMMLPDVEPIPSIAGLQPELCEPCAPWDEECQARREAKKKANQQAQLPGLGEYCAPTPGCQEGYVCSDLGVCDAMIDEPSSSGGFPEHFYAHLAGGVGFGYVNKDFTISQVDFGDSEQGIAPPDPTDLPDELMDYVDRQGTKPRGAITEITVNPGGMAFGGIPIRLALGFNVTPKLSIEVSGRFDVYIANVKSPQSCWDLGDGSIGGFEEAYNQTLEEAKNRAIEYADANGQQRPTEEELDRIQICNANPLVEGTSDEAREAIAKRSYVVAMTAAGEPTYREVGEYQYAWLVNARARYRFFEQGGLGLSFFGGLGYGNVQYRVANDTNAYFPMPSGFDVELGFGLAYYFTKNIGFVVDIPIDILVGDGFALNFDAVLGLSFGF